MWRDWKFYAHPPTEAIVQQFWAKKGVVQLSHPPYSPDLGHQLFRFPTIKIGDERWPLCFDGRHSEICNCEIKSVPNFWLYASYETAQRSHQRVYSCVRRLFRINITYFNFLHFLHHFRNIVAKLTEHTFYYSNVPPCNWPQGCCQAHK